MFSLTVDDEIKLGLLEQRHAQSLMTVIDANRVYLNERLAWTDSIRSLADAERFIARSLQQFAKQKGFNAGIFYHGELVGILGLDGIDNIARSAFIGYWLAETQQKKGIMRRACAALVDYCFNDINLHRITIRIEVGNIKSLAIPEILGFKQEGILRDSYWLFDRFVDAVVYSKLKTDIKNPI